MNKLYLILFTVLLVSTSQFAIAQDYDSPVGYMEVISKQQENISKIGLGLLIIFSTLN